MEDTLSRRRRWMGLAVLIGVTYAAVGITFAWPATHVRAWRLAAWLVSAIVFGGHLVFEQFRLRSTPLRASTHAALAVALGAFGLALGALVHSFRVGSSPEHHRLILIALVAWPLITAIPAFVGALAATAVLAWWRRRAG
jgi:hypothetical protein